MKYIGCEGAGGSEIMRLMETTIPEPGPGQIRIQISHAGINRPDIMQRAGHYPAPPGASPILGLECSGVIDKLGEGAKGSIGDRVLALLPGGGYAEYALVNADHALPIPGGLSMIEAAAIAECFFTVWTNVFDRAGLKAGEKFLVHGGASGIGTSAIQMARALGAKVWATAGSEKKCAACEKLGAKAINYRDEDFAQILKAQKQQMDVILDMVGGEYIAKNIASLASEGRLVNIAYQRGARVEIDFMRVMLKRLHISGSTLRTRSDEDKAAIARALEEHIWPRLANGKIAPVIDRVFPLSAAALAHDYLEAGAHIGKIVLAVDEGIE